eukprot:CAMPEP_0117551574 /NCGR_PEP_ID=MMETSP0784-20121206/49260_1 /TAXON_ID=39447 /ORGANISM="" /LENGTH=483 /DNA_ID=CAMNT_0005348615 /DNA_START=51 /DNA_END=1502 /DNA_ORIENTATION=+
MAYSAPLVVACFLPVQGWRRFCVELERRGRSVPAILQYHSIVYAILICLILDALNDASRVLVASAWLDPETTRAYVEEMNRKDNMSTGDSNAQLRAWEETASLEHYRGLALFSLASPLWVILTLVVSAVHTLRHLRVVRLRGLFRVDLHDKMILILMLPLSYGIMSLKAMIRTWQVCVDHIGAEGEQVFSSWSERKGFLMELSDSNFMVGDIWETYALVTFGKLIMAVLEEQLYREHCEIDELAQRAGVMALSPLHTKDKYNMARGLFRSSESLTIAGIRLFNYSTLLQAIYNVCYTSLHLTALMHPTVLNEMQRLSAGILPSADDVFNSLPTEATKKTVHDVFMGAGYATSFAAIGNIMLVESNFHDVWQRDELKCFKPSLKFWCTKVLVTLAFLQSILLMIIPPFSGWSDVRNNLLYSSVLCMECFVISVVHLVAWDVDAKWCHEKVCDDNPVAAKFAAFYLRCVGGVPSDSNAQKLLADA